MVGMRVGAGADFVQVTWVHYGTRNGYCESVFPAWRNEALKMVCGEDHHKSAVEKTVYEKTIVNHVQMNASLDLSRCAWSDQLRNSLKNDAHVNECVSLQIDYAAAAAAAEYCVALQEWISSGLSQEKSMVLLLTALQVKLLMIASQETLMNVPALLKC